MEKHLCIIGFMLLYVNITCFIIQIADQFYTFMFTHNISSLYDKFPLEKAFALAQRLEIHYTPKHGSWLNIAEIELAALSKQCLEKRRIDNLEDLNTERKAWYISRNTKQKGADWRFTTEDARIKLKKLYPTIQE